MPGSCDCRRCNARRNNSTRYPHQKTQGSPQAKSTHVTRPRRILLSSQSKRRRPIYRPGQASWVEEPKAISDRDHKKAGFNVIGLRIKTFQPGHAAANHCGKAVPWRPKVSPGCRRKYEQITGAKMTFSLGALAGCAAIPFFVTAFLGTREALPQMRAKR